MNALFNAENLRKVSDSQWEMHLALFFSNEHAQSAKMKKRNTFNVLFFLETIIYPCSMSSLTQTESKTFRCRHGLLLRSLLYDDLFSGLLIPTSLINLKPINLKLFFYVGYQDSGHDSSEFGLNNSIKIHFKSLISIKVKMLCKMEQKK